MNKVIGKPNLYKRVNQPRVEVRLDEDVIKFIRTYANQKIVQFKKYY